MENKNINGKVQRGEIYLYDFGNNGGSIQNGVRPALVVQCNEGNAASSTTIIAAMTSIIKKQYLPSPHHFRRPIRIERTVYGDARTTENRKSIRFH